MTDIITYNQVEDRIITLRNKPVLIDSDVATVYGVATREVNQAVKNNPNKFRQGYIFEIDREEKTELVKNFDQFNRLKHSTVMVKLKRTVKRNNKNSENKINTQQ